MTSIEHWILTLRSGNTAEVSFVREGKPVSGMVILPQQGEIRTLYVGIEPAPAFGYGRWLDIVACDEEGRFQTAHIPPGPYVVHAAGYRLQPRYQPFGMISDRIDYTGSAPVTVPPDGRPPEVRIELKGR